jgi:hypothetical protein
LEGCGYDDAAACVVLSVTDSIPAYALMYVFGCIVLALASHSHGHRPSIPAYALMYVFWSLDVLYLLLQALASFSHPLRPLG